MLEEDLRRAICLEPNLIEDGLRMEAEEFPISGPASTYRCDLRGVDRNGVPVYIELKLVASDSTPFQIMKYRSFARETGRFMVVATSFRQGVQKVLIDNGYEAITVDVDRITSVLDRNKGNPLLYARRNGIRLPPTPSTRSVPSHTPEEREIVLNLMDALASTIPLNLPEGCGVNLIRKPDNGSAGRVKKLWLLFTSPTSDPSDRFTIYARPRVLDGLDLGFTPSYSTSGAIPDSWTKRKSRFFELVRNDRGQVEQDFGLPLYEMKPQDEFEDHLVITHQRWKGFYLRINKPLAEWANPDFAQVTAGKFLDFVSKTTCLLNRLGF